MKPKFEFEISDGAVMLLPTVGLMNENRRMCIGIIWLWFGVFLTWRTKRRKK